MMRSTLLAALVSAAFPMMALAQTADELKNDQKTPGDVLTYGMGYGHQRFSPLTQINRDNVKRLVPAWSYSMADNRRPAVAAAGQGRRDLSSPIMKRRLPLDALTGKQIWKSMIEYAPETTRVVCCGIVNRGAAMFDGKLFRTTLDANVIALDTKTGKELWRTKSADPKDGYSMTVAPLVANGVVIAGVAGAEFGHRGYLEGYDPQTGKCCGAPGPSRSRARRAPRPGRRTSPGRPAAASTWITGSYDPELDLVFWGTGNPAPWNPLGRIGDNLYTNTTLALRPKTGEIVWYYQTTPGDPFDYDGVNELVHADLAGQRDAPRKVDHAGEPQRVPLCARARERQAVGRQQVRQGRPGPTASTWRPAVRCGAPRPRRCSRRAPATRSRSGRRCVGGKNWAPMSYSPQTGLAYVNATRLRLGLRGRAARGARQAQARRHALFTASSAKYVFDHPEDAATCGRSIRSPASRNGQMPLQEPQHGRHHGDGGRARLHRPAHRRVRGGRRRDRQAAVAVQPAVPAASVSPSPGRRTASNTSP